jgi:Uri superfamily endonuclease
MIKNVKFSYTVSAKAFPRRIAELLQQQITESNIYEDIENGIEHLKTEDYELFFAYLANAKAELEILSLSLGDAEDNVRGFLQADQPNQSNQTQPEQPTQQAQQNIADTAPQTAPVNNPEAQKNAFEQLKQLESLVNVMKELKGGQQP